MKAKVSSLIILLILIISSFASVSTVPFYVKAQGGANLSDSTTHRASTSSAEPPSSEWNRTYGGANHERALSLVQTEDGGYASAGWTASFGVGESDFWLIKTDSAGNMQWNKTYGGASYDVAYSLVQTDDGGYALAGYTYSFGVGESDFWLIKTDSAGNMQWNKTYGTGWNDMAFSLVATSDEGYALAGLTSSYSAGSNFWLVKTDSAGNAQWNKTYGAEWYDDVAYSLVQTNDGGYAMTGWTESYGAGAFDAWLVRTDAAGNMQWNKTFGKSGYDEVYSMVLTEDGGYALAGWTDSSGTVDHNVWVIKADSNGNMQWNITWGGTSQDYANSIVQANDGGYALAGYTSPNTGGTSSWLARTDTTGNEQWNRTFGENGYYDVYSMVLTGDGGYALAGSTSSLGAGGGDFWLIKLASTQRTWIVDDDGPADFSKIQEAINAANRGDEILIRSGTYFEALVIHKPISLIGENKHTTIIDGTQNKDTGTVVDIEATRDVRISGFTIRNGTSPVYSGMGISLFRVERSEIIGNILKQNDNDGIYVMCSSEIVVEDNEIVGNGDIGVNVQGGRDSDGRIIWYRDNSILNNLVTGNGREGVRVKENEDTLVMGNTIAGSFEGIYLAWSRNIIVSGNTVTQSSWHAISVFGANFSQVYHNNFMDNIEQGYTGEAFDNVWDDGYPSGGNYWMDYVGADANCDGIGDTPYVVDADNQDRYPLMNPWSTSPNPPLPPTLSSPANGATIASPSATFSWSSSLGATDYQIEITGPTSKLETVYSTSYTASSLSDGYYTWRVRAHNSYGWSDWTPTWSFKIVEPETLTLYVSMKSHSYRVQLQVPLSVYGEACGKMGNFLYQWYPNIDHETLEHAYYLENHVESPTQYPILSFAVSENDQQILDREFKTKILNEILKYCYELFRAAYPDKLNSYQTAGRAWLKAHEDMTWTVRVSDSVAATSDLITIIAPLLRKIQTLHGGTTSEQVQKTVSLFTAILSGAQKIYETFGSQKGNSIVNVLISYGLVSSADYNVMELYREFEANPSLATQVLEKINSDIMGFELTSDSRSIILTFLTNLGKGSISFFPVGATLGLHAYFGSGLTVSTVSQIVATAFFKALVKYIIPIAIATTISESYVLPMANALHEAWEEMKYEADSYFNLHSLGSRMAVPEAGVLNLTDGGIFAAVYGTLQLIEYHFYMNSYFYKSHQLTTSSSELDSLKTSAENAFAKANEWANMLEEIYSYADAIISQTDPSGSTFDFTVNSPTNVLPYAPSNSSGFVLTVQPTFNVSLSCEDYSFSVENGSWISNFPFSLYVDDVNGTLYLLVFNPPEQKYEVHSTSQTTMILADFKPATDNIAFTDAGDSTGNEAYFSVSNNSVDPASFTTERPSTTVPPLTAIVASLVVIVSAIFLVAAFLMKRRKTKTTH